MFGAQVIKVLSTFTYLPWVSRGIKIVTTTNPISVRTMPALDAPWNPELQKTEIILKGLGNLENRG